MDREFSYVNSAHTHTHIDSLSMYRRGNFISQYSTHMTSIQQFKLHIQKLSIYLKRYRLWAVLTIVFILSKEGAILLEPAIYKSVIEVFEELFAGSIVQDEAIRRSLILIMLFMAIQAVVMFTNMFMFRYINRLEVSVMRDAANDFVAKVLNLSFRFHSERKTGKLAKEFARGVNAIEGFLDAFLFNMIPLTMRIVVIVTVFAFIDWVIALIMLAMVLVFCAFTVYASNKVQQHRDKANTTDDEGSRKAMDALMNAEAVKYFQQEHEEIHSFKKVRQKWKEQKQHEWDSWIWITTGQIFINVAAVTGILFTMIQRLLGGELALSDFVLVISYLGLAIGLLWEFQHHIRRFQESFTDLTSFFRYYDEENEIVDAFGAGQLEASAGQIAFRNVSFSYESGKTVLDDVSFTIPAGKSVAFVGPSGVGKSTIMKLLYRFYDIPSGQILIDGQDISQVTQKSLREALGIVPQETALFNETIAYNIAYGQPDISMDQIREAARLAHTDEFIERLPDGYDTLVGERGVKLSGGEKQRISIARAFLRDAPILVLDEATASLDSASEAAIQESLKDLMHGRTTLIIAHRLSTIMNADHIIVLSEGKVAQEGTHDELIAQGGLYKQLWELQAGGYI